MSADEIIKHIPEIASVTKVAIGAVPFTAIVKRILGPAADELAEMWRDQVRLYRYERQLKCVEKAEKMAKDAGFTPQAVPPKILFPLLEGASFEDNEDLHTMWAALLANAASPEHSRKVRPSHLAILKQMSPDEAAMLRFVFEYSLQTPELSAPLEALGSFYNSLGVEFEVVRDRTPQGNSVNWLNLGLSTCLDTLEASNLIFSTGSVRPELKYHLASRGRAFIEACCPPTPKS